MPARSNEFQRLVFLVKKVVSADAATVTESKFLIDRLTGQEREVDVCIEAKVGGHPIIVSLECYDHKRAANVEWVDRMIGKHARLPTNSLVLASRSGFSKRAISAAKVVGVELLTYKTITEEQIGKAVNLADHLWAMTFSLTITKVRGDVPAQGNLPGERIALAADNWVFDEQGTRIATMAQAAYGCLKDPRVAEQFRREGDESHRFFSVEVGNPKTGSGRMYVEKIEPRMLRPVERLSIDGTCQIGKGRISLQHGVLGTVRVAWGATVLRGRDAMVVAVKQEGAAATTMTLHIAGSKEDEAER